MKPELPKLVKGRGIPVVNLPQISLKIKDPLEEEEIISIPDYIRTFDFTNLIKDR